MRSPSLVATILILPLLLGCQAPPIASDPIPEPMSPEEALPMFAESVSAQAESANAQVEWSLHGVGGMPGAPRRQKYRFRNGRYEYASN